MFLSFLSHYFWVYQAALMCFTETGFLSFSPLADLWSMRHKFCSVQNTIWMKTFRTERVCEEAFCRKLGMFSRLWAPGETCQIPPCWVKETMVL